MAKDTDSGMNSDARHVYGPRPVGALIPRLTRPAFRRRAPGTAQVLADWPAIVGPALAAVTTPRRLARGSLTIACAGPIALELQHLSGELLARINTHLGSAAVQDLRFVQTLSTPPPPGVVPLPPPERLAAMDAAVADLPAGELRNALAALGRALAGQAASGAPKP